MTKVIKGTDRGCANQGVAFNFDDLAAQAETRLEGARAEAARLIAQARDEADAIREQAKADGLRAAEAEIDRLLEERVAQRLQTFAPALEAAAREVRGAKHSWLAQWDGRAVRLATAIARRVIRCELRANPDIPVELVREALQLATGAQSVRVRVHPVAAAAVGTRLRQLLDELATGAQAELIADPTIGPGGCRVETENGTIDQQFEAQLARIEEEWA
ncbi:MAG: hypothetical protein HYX69_02235 [Planctomycetia bacterium]|nr:hypothetical protein [Planctomycetia bacterium]